MDERYYSEKLWSLLPAIYRAEDAGALRELVERFGAQAAVLRTSIDRLWEDQSIESCDDWIISYIADLLATNLVASLDARGQRVDVAKTIYYRRRKGTVPLLEELAADITGWNARVVEFFRRLGRNWHGLDPAPGSGGYADLRNVHRALHTKTAFDEFSYTADMRLGRGNTGWHNIPHVGVFLWRLRSISIVGSTPVRDAVCKQHITFDPSGRDIPLFSASRRSYGNTWTSPREPDLPGPIHHSLEELYGWNNAVSLLFGAAAEANVISPLAPHTIDPARGRAHLASGTDPDNVLVAYHYGFPSTIGAGGYDRRLPGPRPVLPVPSIDVVGGKSAFAFAPPTGTVRIRDSLTYTSVPDVALAPGDTLAIVADNRTRPVVRLEPRAAWTFLGQTDADGRGSELILDGLWLCGCDVVLDGTFERVTIRTCTIDPGSARDGTTLDKAADGVELAPCRLVVQGHVRNLVIDRCVLGPISADVGTLDLRDSVVQAVLDADDAVGVRTGMSNVLRTTIFGKSKFHRIEASNVIFDDVAITLDAQHGCTRFSAYATGSELPRLYECVEIAPDAHLFMSRWFGDPSYAQLRESVGEAIAEGADDGSEMGAYCREKNAVKARSLLVKFQEYMPASVTPVLIYVT